MTTRRRHEGDSYGGFFLGFEPKRTERIAARLDEGREVVESFSAADWDLGQAEITLLSLTTDDPSIGGAALMERMHGTGGTGRLKMRLQDSVLFSNPISLRSLRLHSTLIDSLSTANNLRRLLPSDWASLMEEIADARPDEAPALRELLGKRLKDHSFRGEEPRIVRLNEQRDALGLTLDIAGLDRHKVLRGVEPSRAPAALSVLDLLDQEELHEQDLVRQDQGVFQSLLTTSSRQAVFAGRSGRSVRVHVYDKKPLETVLGTDLLIYQQVFESFLLIQYKSMRRRNEHSSSWSYLADNQLVKQMNAMLDAQSEIDQQVFVDGGLWDWRLHSSPFYFKFCETNRTDSRTDDLVRGITIGFGHLERFLALPDSLGPKGGRRIGYDNCPRYLNNSQFVDLAGGGWIGCDRRGLNMIAGVLDQSRGEGRVALFAEVDEPRAGDAQQRRGHWRE